MANTTIDGLVVRSSKKRPVRQASRSSGTGSAKGSSAVMRKARKSSAGFTTANDSDWSAALAEMSRENEAVASGVARTAIKSTASGETASGSATSAGTASGRREVRKAGSWEELLENESETTTDEFLSNDRNDFLDDGPGFLDDEDAFEEQLLAERPSERQKRHETRQPRKKKHTARKIVLVLVLLLAMAGAAVYFWGDGLISRLTGGQSGLWSTISAMVSDVIPFQTDAQGRTNVLIFGTQGYDMSGTTGDGVHDGSQLTDSIMVVSFDQETKDVVMISLPRDLKVPMACSAGKINEVFWCYNQNGTDEQAGAEGLMEQVGEVLGLELQYYAHVNWGSLVYVVDRLGGITVTLDEDIADYGWTNAVAEAGVPITVNGEQALALARARHGTAGGDFTRGNTQQKILEAIAQRIMDEGLGWSEAIDILNNLGDNLRSNFSTDNIKAALKMLKGFQVDQMRQVALVSYDGEGESYLTTAMIDEISYVVPQAGTNDFSEIQAYVAKMILNDPLAREGAKIAVYNATEGYGLASTEKLALEEAGLTVTRVSDASAASCAAQYCVFRTARVKTDDETGAGIDVPMPETEAWLTEKYGVMVGTLEEMPDEVYTPDVDLVVIIGSGV